MVLYGEPLSLKKTEYLSETGASDPPAMNDSAMQSEPKQLAGKQRPLWQRIVASRGLRLIVGFILLAWLLVWLLDAFGGPQAFRDRYGLSAAVVLVLIHGVVAVSPLPGEAVAFANSLVYGFWFGSLFNWIGWMLAALMEYALVRRAAKEFNSQAAFERVPLWLRRFPVAHPAFLIAGRWLPFGGHLVNCAAGAFAVGLWRHAWCSAIAIVPVAMLVAGLANGLVHL